VTIRSTRPTKRLAVSDVAGAIDQRVLSSDEIGRHDGAEVASMNRHSFPDFRWQLGRRAHEYRNHVTGGERLSQHVATERPGRAQDQESGHVRA
jgi:hypothetical protein